MTRCCGHTHLLKHSLRKKQDFKAASVAVAASIVQKVSPGKLNTTAGVPC
jgi:hypothetical protein